MQPWYRPITVNPVRLANQWVVIGEPIQGKIYRKDIYLSDAQLVVASNIKDVVAYEISKAKNQILKEVKLHYPQFVHDAEPYSYSPFWALYE